MNASMLFYDIPDSANIPNPSGKLRRRAVRINLSCWLIRTEDVPYSLLNGMASKGAKWYVLKFDPTEAGRLLQLAADNLKRDLQLAEERADRSAESAHNQLQDSTEDAGQALAHYLNRVKQTVKRMDKLVADFSHVSKLFGIDTDTLPLSAVTQAAEAIRLGAHARAKEYAEMADAAGRLGDKGRAIQAAMLADDIPAEIVADFLEESGQDTSRTRELFSVV